MSLVLAIGLCVFALLVLMGVIVYAACVVASDDDDLSEQQFNEMMGKKRVGL
jgi:hypothetical protein